MNNLSTKVIMVLMVAAHGGCVTAPTRPAVNGKAVALVWPIDSLETKEMSPCALFREMMLKMPMLATQCQREDERKISIKVESATGKTVIEQFLAQHPGYSYLIEDGFLVLAPSTTLRNPDNPLNWVVDKFQVKDMTMDHVMNSIHLRVKETTGRLVYFDRIDIFRDGAERPDLNLDLSSKTVRSIMLHVARQRHHSLWLRINEGDEILYSIMGYPSKFSSYLRKTLKPEYQAEVEAILKRLQ